ncbi:MAG: Na/Pi cotransporter family protein [Clostridia bacterium]|nr:Na/Pi cotransporter family protein [Clostridia bacterium]
MIIPQIIKLFGGIALFLFGMKLMGDGLKKVAGNRLEVLLYRLSSTTLKGVLLGTGVTAVIQSSAATSVMAVGFVNSKMMKLKQAVSVILGAILGTSITGWIICLNYIEGGGAVGVYFSSSNITYFVGVVGIILAFFLKGQQVKQIGSILMGFTVLMLGMSTMSNSVSSLAELEAFQTFLVSLNNPILAVIVGFLFTGVLQSASAAVGIIQALSVSGSISIGSALPLLMGVAIGASIPVLLSSIGATTDGRRAALIYPATTVLSVMACSSVFYILDALFSFTFLSLTADPFVIAIVNSFLRLAMVLLLFPFTDIIEALVISLVREKKRTEEDGPVLEDMFLSHPALAVEQSRTAIFEMAKKSKLSLDTSMTLLAQYRQEAFDQVSTLENSIDRYEDSLGTYLSRLTGHELTAEQNRDVSIFLHTLSDFERISDHAENISESAREIRDKGLEFSENAKNEMRAISAAVTRIVQITIDAFLSSDLDAAKTVEPLEDLIDELCDRSKLNHTERVRKGECTIPMGFVLNDLLSNFERVSDHCSNIAAAMIELNSDEFDTHRYLGQLKSANTKEFEELFESYSKEFNF